MKTRFAVLGLILALFAGAISIAEGTRSQGPQGVPLAPVNEQMAALGGETMSLLIAASGFESMLSNCEDTRNYTVFVPKEEVWAPLLDGLGLSLEQLLADRALIRNVLLMHMVPSNISPTQLTSFSPMTLPSVAGLNIAVTSTLNPLSVTVNSKPIVQRSAGSTPDELLENLSACNGWVYLIDGILLPPGGGGGGIGVGPGLTVAISSSAPLTQNPYAVYELTFSNNVSGVEPSDFGNTGTAPGCQFSIAPRPAQWNTSFSVLVTCAGLGTIIPTFTANGVNVSGGATGPSTAATGPTVTIVSGPVLETKVISGGGTVSSSPGGINCGETCVGEFASGTTISLTATPADGYIFAGWSGACTGTQTCVVTMNSSTQVKAEFSPAGQVNVIKAGSGQGTVASKTGGVNCGTICNVLLKAGTQITLTAKAARGSRFVGWYGACTGSSNCILSIGAFENLGISDVFAIFEPT